MILIFIFLLVLLIIGISLLLIIRKQPSPTGDASLSILDSLLPPAKCTPKLEEMEEYVATYVLDSDGKCLPETCKPGYNLYYSDPKSINKFKRCQ